MCSAKNPDHDIEALRAAVTLLDPDASVGFCAVSCVLRVQTRLAPAEVMMAAARAGVDLDRRFPHRELRPHPGEGTRG